MYLLESDTLTHCVGFFFFQAEDGIRDLVRSRGLGDVYKRQLLAHTGLELQCGAKSKGKPSGHFRFRDERGDVVLSLIHI